MYLCFCIFRECRSFCYYPWLFCFLKIWTAWPPFPQTCWGRGWEKRGERASTVWENTGGDSWHELVFSARDSARAEHWWRCEPREEECEQWWWELGKMICSLSVENKWLMSMVSWQVGRGSEPGVAPPGEGAWYESGFKPVVHTPTPVPARRAGKTGWRAGLGCKPSEWKPGCCTWTARAEAKDRGLSRRSDLLAWQSDLYLLSQQGHLVCWWLSYLFLN